MRIIGTALRQAAADIRIQFWGTSLIGFAFAPAVLIGVSKTSGGSFLEGNSLPFGIYMLTGLVGSYGSFLYILIAQEVYIERLNGTLLRIKTLPHGVGSWMVGKSLSAGVTIFLQTVLIVVLGVLLFEKFTASPLQILLMLAFALLMLAAHTPLAFLISLLVRGTWTTMLAYLIGMIIVILSCAIVPLTLFPTWLWPIIKIFPGYWTTYLTHQVFFDAATCNALAARREQLESPCWCLRLG